MFPSLLRPKTGHAVYAIIAGLMAVSLIGLRATYAETIKQRPCDICVAGKTPCVAAHSTVRSLYAKYAGALYQVKRESDNATQDIGLLADGYANAATQDAFCANTSCIITKIFDQSPGHNDLAIASGGHFKGPGPNDSDLGAAADALPVTAGGHQVYGVSISPGRTLVAIGPRHCLNPAPQASSQRTARTR
jgi:hypothetical protein